MLRAVNGATPLKINDWSLRIQKKPQRMGLGMRCTGIASDSEYTDASLQEILPLYVNRREILPTELERVQVAPHVQALPGHGSYSLVLLTCISHFHAK